MNPYKIGIIGLGYVGLPLAQLFIKQNQIVYGVDIDEVKINQLKQRKSYLSDLSDKDIDEMFTKGTFFVNHSFSVLKKVDAIIICVPTPLTSDYSPNLEYVRKALELSLPFMKKGQLIVLESSTYPGMTEEEICPLIESQGLKIGEDIFVAFSPERIDPGQQTYKLEEIPKVIGGVTEKCAKFSQSVYETIFEKVVIVSSPKVAEMCKLVENTQRLINISFMNELAILCEKMKINLWEVIDAASTKPFGFIPYYPGPGIGGHCIPVDPLYLDWKAKKYGFETKFIQLAHKMNEEMPNYIVDRVKKHLPKQLNEASILVIGIAYKKDVNDARESAALSIIERLHEKGAKVHYHDPYISEIKVSDRQFTSTSLSPNILNQVDCTLILTDHSKLPYENIVRHSPLVIDTRNATREVRERENVILL
ncbi:MAG TPA: nucleotide sugar dehydrogenase [Bacilli bacterium]|nr:nucleotide sugar dehydrogenase [Bacilli bacterium]